MKLNKKRSWILLLSMITIVSMSGCGGDGENGASSDNNLLYELHLPIFRPGLPVDPTNPGSPIIDPIDPISPTPITPTLPTVPSNPTDPTPITPTLPTVPSNPTDPTPITPTLPTVPSNPTDPTPITPTLPTVPNNPTNPTDNLPPVAIASINIASVIVDPDFSTRVIFDGSASYDQDELYDPIIHIWTSGNDQVENVIAEAFLSCKNDYTNCKNNVCIYTATLEVFDGELYDTDSVQLNVDYNNCIDEVLPPEPLPCGELIKDKPDSIYITNNPETVKVDASTQLHLWGVFAEGTVCELTTEPAAVWSVNNTDHDNIATIGTKTGIAIGKNEGTAIVEAKYRSDGADSTVTSVLNVVE